MALDDRAGLTATDVHRWLWGLQWFHAARFAVMAAVVGATIVSAVDPTGCTPEAPCGLSPQGTWWLALFFASVVLLIFAPRLGCLSALALGILGAGYDPALGARVWWAAEAALSAAALVFLLLIRVHQHRVAAAMKRPITLPVGRSATAANWQGLRAQFTTTDEDRATFILFAASVGIVSMLLYQYQPDDLYLSDASSFVRQLGLVGELNDQTPWLSFAILAWLLAAALTLKPARVWWSHRRPIDGDLRGILVSTRWLDLDKAGEVSATDGSGLRLCVLMSPVPARLVAEPDKDWTPPELVVMTGQLWYGGVVQLYALNGEALADAIMGLPQLTLLRSWHAAPPPPTSRAPLVIYGDGPHGAAELTPFRAHGRHRRLFRWTLWFYAVLAVGTVGFVVAGALPNDSDWWTLVILLGSVPLCLVPFLPHLARAHVAVNEDGVTVVNSFSTYRIPWGAIHKVELKLAQDLWEEWSSTPEDDFQLVFNTTYGIISAEVPLGPDSPTGGMAAIVNRIVDYRDRTRVTDGHPATAVKVTGAAARRRRERSPVSDALPPANIAGRVQDDATASQPPTGGRHRFGRR